MSDRTPQSEASPRDKAKAAFIEWFLKNYPMECVLARPAWHAPKIFRAVEAALDDAGYSPVSETSTPDWQPMVSAPLDGTEIQLLVRHHDYWTALKLDGKKHAEEKYQGVVIGKWIDHNGGGWTWHGGSGSPVGWRPMGALNPKAAWPFPEKKHG